MHLESRCYSSSAINKQTNSAEDGIGHAATTASTSVNRTWLRNQKKDKTSGAGIFSFLQKFRVVNGKNEENATADLSFSLASPQSSRYSLTSVGVGAGRRWESIESVISSATATSFAFIPPHQLRQFNYPRPPPRTGAFERDQHSGRGRYRLVADENRPAAVLVDSKNIANVKRLNRNSTGNIENFWIPNNVQCAAEASASSPKKDALIILNKRKRCYRPGKRKAPPPPDTSTNNRFDRGNVNGTDIKITNDNRSLLARGVAVKYEEEEDDDEDYENDENRDINVIAKQPVIAYRKKKKRQAPPPPTRMNDQRPSTDSGVKTQRKIIDPLQLDPDDDEPITYSNDSLKLEKGILKANKHSVEINTKNDATKLASPITPQIVAVSPKPWYKRSCVKVNAHNNLGGFREKRNSCRKDEMDRWMLESGIARFRRTDDDIFKRHSHISVLANISELDRQASEILEKQRKQQRDAMNSAEAKFYSDLLDNDQTARKERFLLNESASPSTKKNKDLISILNNLTSVTKMTVHSAFVSKTASREGNDDENKFLASGSNASSINKITERSRQQTSSNLSINKNKKQSKIGEVFDKSSHRDVRKKDDKKSLNKSSSSFDTANDMKTSFKEIPTLGTATDALIPIKTSFESDNVNKSNDKTVKQQLPRPVQKPFSSWSCPQCNSENPSWKFICEKCKKWRPYSISSRTTDQRLFVNIEKDNLKKSNDSDTDNQQEQRPPLQVMYLNAKNTVTTQQNHNSNGTNLVKSSKSSERSTQRDFNRREFYSSIAATVDDTVVETGKSDTSSALRNNLNGTQPTRSQISQTLQYYNNQDRKMLCDILKELRNSLSSSKQNIMAIDTDMANEQKIINNVNSVIFESSPKAKEKSAVVDTSLNDVPRAAKTCNAASSTKVIQRNHSTDVQLNSINSKSENHLSVKQNEADHIEEGEIMLNERKLNDSKLMVENKNVPVLAINRLLKKLQTAIANGQHHEAANIARELARLKVSCHMTRRGNFNNASSSSLKIENPSSSSTGSLGTFVISAYIKEQNHCRGPIPLQIDNTTTLQQLKYKLNNEFKIPLERQQWRSEKSILNDETAVLYDIGIDKPGIPMYIHLANNEEIADENTNKTDAGSSSTEKNITTTVDNIPPATQNKEYGSSANIPLEKFDLQTPINKHANLEIQDDTEVDEIDNEQNTDEPQQTIHTRHEVDLENDSGTPLTPILNEIDDRITQTILLTNPGWQCTLCTLINESHVKFCAACGEQYANADTSGNNEFNVNNLASTSQQNHLYAPWRIAKKDNNVNNHNQGNKTEDEKQHYYQELIDLEKNDLITNKESFECSICMMECEENEGVVLRDCLHTFCKGCLQQTVQFSTEAQVKCPFGNASYSCDSVLQEREIKTLVDADTYEKHLARSLSEAQNKIKNAFHCKTPNCTGWCIYEDNVNEFRCPVCRKTNCLTCQVIHGGLNCKQYQEMTKKESENNADTSKTRNMLEEMVEKGEAMVCPTCDIILMKKWGCDWLRCSMCKTEICWVTRGPRWGPAGKGDTSAGCRCGVNGVKCHPRCNYCH